MAHKTLVGGTAYNVSGGKSMVSGTVYNIANGKTLVGGTGYDISFGPSFVSDVSAILNDNDWETISDVSTAGLAANYWSVGDRKAIILNGTCSKLTFSNQAYYAYILGFNHNPIYEGNNSIHFQFGFDSLTDGINCAFMSGYNDDSDFYMNPTATNSGGWENSFMRNTVCSTFFTCLPSDLQNVIKLCAKYSDNTGSGKNIASYVTSTRDYLWLLAEYEVFGERNGANEAEQNYQAQYAYYANGNSKTKYRADKKSSKANWWLRSAYYGNADYFCGVSSALGSATFMMGSAHYSNGFAPAFCV